MNSKIAFHFPIILLCGILFSLSSAQNTTTRDQFLTVKHSCLSDTVQVEVTSKTPFNGLIYVNERLNNPKCRQSVRNDTTPKLLINYKDCATIESDGEYSIFVIIQPNTKYETSESFNERIVCPSALSTASLYNEKRSIKNSSKSNWIKSKNFRNVHDPDTEFVSTSFTFSDNDGKEISNFKLGDEVHLVINVESDSNRKFKDGLITVCELQDSQNSSVKKIICDECEVDKSVINKWKWDEDGNKFSTNMTIVNRLDVKTVNVECSGMVCMKKCPQATCLPQSP